ncbi:helicase [Peribacillus asahii]|uniref:Helicase n=1 Tax=Peribacillus asahii TaxID=228899 RepID=A0A398BNV4_9BACI|nr:helicase-related protein [Peribacillus asahii]RID89026.1 helicase [Peribacillus asahii]
MLRAGDVVKGPQFPETVEIKKCEAIDEVFYVVEAIGRTSNQFFEILVEKDSFASMERLNVSDSTEQKLDPLDIQQYLLYNALRNEAKYAKTRALGSKNLLPLPHQIEAVYGRMLQVPQTRFLLADDPGAGKTIMSGMLIKELKARHSVERILILVPPLVLKQWQEELYEKFHESFHIINRAVVKEYGGKNPFVSNNQCLASVYWAAKDDIKQLINEAQFDLIIVDEAHKMAAYTHGTIKKKTTRTKLYQLGELLLRKVPHCLLLTATPHKGDMENFRHLMKLIDEDIFSNTSVNETLREKSNPFIIRRLKENLKNFDGTPIFPKRTTKTIQYHLTDEELDLYDAVTNYVKEHFNRAMNNGNNSTAFAMMLLQRRLSSSIEAIHLSLQRRYKRLRKLYQQTEMERNKYMKLIEKMNVAEYDEETNEQQELMEQRLEQAVDLIDTEELEKELKELKRLLAKTTHLQTYAIERKYQELEETLFGVDGLLHQGEKILIFTEAADTMNYLERKLLERVPKVAKIVGSFSMDERRRQVEMFRNECQIMIATDAGGESINLQFCNQMINYDIPWNPNKLEQRMGRIHRIGQKNEVFIFNLVAQNTREGHVMTRLLEKMEKMKEDLGSDLVYNFIGELLEDHDSLASIMQEAVLNREKLDDVIAKMDKAISDEHLKILKVMQEERLDEETIDVPSLKREQGEITVQKIPFRTHLSFADYILKKRNVRVLESNEGKVKRIERIPKFLRESFPQLHLTNSEVYRYTGYKEYETSDVSMLHEDHSIFKLAMELTAKESEKFALGRYMISYDIPEPLSVEVYSLTINDGTGKELQSQIIYMAKRQDGSIIQLDPYWLSISQFEGALTELNSIQDSISMSKALAAGIEIRDKIRSKREIQLNKLANFLNKAFHSQYNDTLAKLNKYQMENADNKNSALINQMNAQLIDIDAKKEERTALINRQRNITMKPPKRLVQMELIPTGRANRVLAVDYYRIVEVYEKQNGRQNVKMFDNMALVDFYSERFNGEERFIIISNNDHYMPTEEHLEDLGDMLEKVYIYIVKHGQVVAERAMREELFIYKQ